MALSDAQIAKAIAYGGIGVGAMFPAKSLYNSGQEDRGLLNTAAHLAVGNAVGGAIGYGAIYGATAYGINKVGPEILEETPNFVKNIAKSLTKVV